MLGMPFASLKGLSLKWRQHVNRLLQQRGEERSVRCVAALTLRGESFWLCWGGGCRAWKSEETGRLYWRRNNREASWMKTCHLQNREWTGVTAGRGDGEWQVKGSQGNSVWPRHRPVRNKSWMSEAGRGLWFGQKTLYALLKSLTPPYLPNFSLFYRVTPLSSLLMFSSCCVSF